jgi:serine/threonine protein kinase
MPKSDREIEAAHDLFKSANAPLLAEELKNISEGAEVEELKDEKNQKILNSEQIEQVKNYFNENPDAVKLSRRDPAAKTIFGENAVLEGFSIIKLQDPDNPGGFKLCAAYIGKARKAEDHNRLLGEGSFGRVKLGQMLESGDWVALKIQKADHDDKDRQKEISEEDEKLKELGEAKGTAKRDKQQQDNSETKFYTAMVLGPAMDLRAAVGALEKQYADQPNQLQQKKLQIAILLTKTVSAWHKKYNWVHRDLKSGNILLDPSQSIGDDPDSKVLKIIDFGSSAKLVNHEYKSTIDGTTPGYIAPELSYLGISTHAKQIYTMQTDAFSVGRILCEVFHPRGINQAMHYLSSEEEKEEGIRKFQAENYSSETLAEIPEMSEKDACSSVYVELVDVLGDTPERLQTMTSEQISLRNLLFSSVHPDPSQRLTLDEMASELDQISKYKELFESIKREYSENNEVQLILDRKGVSQLEIAKQLVSVLPNEVEKLEKVVKEHEERLDKLQKEKFELYLELYIDKLKSYVAEFKGSEEHKVKLKSALKELEEISNNKPLTDEMAKKTKEIRLLCFKAHVLTEELEKFEKYKKAIFEKLEQSQEHLGFLQDAMNECENAIKSPVWNDPIENILENIKIKQSEMDVQVKILQNSRDLMGKVGRNEWLVENILQLVAEQLNRVGTGDLVASLREAMIGLDERGKGLQSEIQKQFNRLEKIEITFTDKSKWEEFNARIHYVINSEKLGVEISSVENLDRSSDVKEAMKFIDRFISIPGENKDELLIAELKEIRKNLSALFENYTETNWNKKRQSVLENPGYRDLLDEYFKLKVQKEELSPQEYAYRLDEIRKNFENQAGVFNTAVDNDIPNLSKIFETGSKIGDNYHKTKLFLENTEGIGPYKEVLRKQLSELVKLKDELIHNADSTEEQRQRIMSQIGATQDKIYAHKSLCELLTKKELIVQSSKRAGEPGKLSLEMAGRALFFMSPPPPVMIDVVFKALGSVLQSDVDKNVKRQYLDTATVLLQHLIACDSANKLFPDFSKSDTFSAAIRECSSDIERIFGEGAKETLWQALKDKQDVNETRRNELSAKLKAKEPEALFNVSDYLERLRDKVDSSDIEAKAKLIAEDMRYSQMATFARYPLNELHPREEGKGSDRRISTQYANRISNMVVEDILGAKSLEHQKRIALLYAYVIKYSIEHGDYATVVAVQAGLGNAIVVRLGFLFTGTVKEYFDKAKEIISSEKNFKAMAEIERNAKEKQEQIVPYIGLKQTTLVFANDGIANTDGSALNVNKMVVIDSVLERVAYFQSLVKSQDLKEPSSNINIRAQEVSPDKANEAEVHYKNIVFEQKPNFKSLLRKLKGTDKIVVPKIPDIKLEYRSNADPNHPRRLNKGSDPTESYLYILRRIEKSMSSSPVLEEINDAREVIRQIKENIKDNQRLQSSLNKEIEKIEQKLQSQLVKAQAESAAKEGPAVNASAVPQPSIPVQESDPVEQVEPAEVLQPGAELHENISADLAVAPEKEEPIEPSHVEEAEVEQSEPAHVLSPDALSENEEDSLAEVSEPFDPLISDGFVDELSFLDTSDEVDDPVEERRIFEQAEISVPEKAEVGKTFDINEATSFAYLRAFVDEVKATMPGNVDGHREYQPLVDFLNRLQDKLPKEYEAGKDYNALYTELHSLAANIPVVDARRKFNKRHDLQHFHNTFFINLYENKAPLNVIVHKGLELNVGIEVNGGQAELIRLQLEAKGAAVKPHHFTHPGHIFNEIKGMIGFGFNPLGETNRPYVIFEGEPKILRFGTQITGYATLQPAFLNYLMVKKAQREEHHPGKPIHHVYFNLMKRPITVKELDIPRRIIESLKTKALEKLNKRDLGIAVVTLPAAGRYFTRGYLTHEGRAKRPNKRYDCDQLKKKTIKSILTGKNDFMIPDSLGAIKDRAILDAEFNESVKSILGEGSERTMITAEERQAILFDFIKYRLPKMIIEELKPDTVNFSCKDAIDRGGVNTLWYEFRRRLDEVPPKPMTLDEFNMNLDAAALLVKSRPANENRNLLWNALNLYYEKTPKQFEGEMSWVKKWIEDNHPNKEALKITTDIAIKQALDSYQSAKFKSKTKGDAISSLTLGSRPIDVPFVNELFSQRDKVMEAEGKKSDLSGRFYEKTDEVITRFIRDSKKNHQVYSESKLDSLLIKDVVALLSQIAKKCPNEARKIKTLKKEHQRNAYSLQEVRKILVEIKRDIRSSNPDLAKVLDRKIGQIEELHVVLKARENAVRQPETKKGAVEEEGNPAPSIKPKGPSG